MKLIEDDRKQLQELLQFAYVRFNELQDYLTRNTPEVKITSDDLVRLANKVGY